MDTFINTEEEWNTPTENQKFDVNDTKQYKAAVEADSLTVLSQEDCRLL